VIVYKALIVGMFIANVLTTNIVALVAANFRYVLKK